MKDDKYINHISKVKAIKLYHEYGYLWLKIVVASKEELGSLKECLATLDGDESDHIHIQPKGKKSRAFEVIVENEKTHKKKKTQDLDDLEEEMVVDWSKLKKLLQSEHS